MPSLSSVWNLNPPSPSPSALPSSSSLPPSSPSLDLEKHSNFAYPIHRSTKSWGTGPSSIHLGSLGGRGLVKRVGFVVGLSVLGLWMISLSMGGTSGGGALLEGWSSSQAVGVKATGKNIHIIGPHPSGRREIDVASEPLPLDATVQERLDAWENSPGGRGEIPGEIETGGFFLWNNEQCENIWPNKNKDLIEKATPIWSALNRSSIHDIRMNLVDQVRAADFDGRTRNHGTGRGIVFTAGNADTIQRCIYTLRVLRHVYGTTLPAQIYHFPSERPDPDSAQLVELAELGAEMVEAKGEKDPTRTKNYHLKAQAIILSPFQHVLFLDSDNIPTRDPEFLFDSPPYKRLGAMFWPDYWKTNPGNGIWQILGVKCRNEWEQEAGQMLFDKSRHLDALILSQIMLEDHKFWFMFSDGDKDIFRFAFLALRKRWGVPGRYVGVGGMPYGTASGSFCGLTMQQYDHVGEPMFIHYNLLKQVPSGVGRGLSWGRTRQLPTLVDPSHPLPPFTNSTDYSYNVTRGLGDVDCDMLADADDEGHARAPASFEVRKRAAVERGIRPFFHGGSVSALCIDMRLDDPRPDSARAADQAIVDAAKSSSTASSSSEPTEEFDISKLNSLGIKWGEDLLEIAQWKDDPLLKDFEANVYNQGFIPNGKGF